MARTKARARKSTSGKASRELSWTRAERRRLSYSQWFTNHRGNHIPDGLLAAYSNACPEKKPVLDKLEPMSTTCLADLATAYNYPLRLGSTIVYSSCPVVAAKYIVYLTPEQCQGRGCPPFPKYLPMGHVRACRGWLKLSPNVICVRVG